MSEQEWRASGGAYTPRTSTSVVQAPSVTVAARVPVVGAAPARGSLVGALADRFLTKSPQVPVDPALEAARVAAQSARDRSELINVLCGGQIAPKVEKVVTFVMNDPLGQEVGQASAAAGAVALGAILISRIF